MVSVSKTCPTVLYIRDVEKLLCRSILLVPKNVERTVWVSIDPLALKLWIWMITTEVWMRSLLFYSLTTLKPDLRNMKGPEYERHFVRSMTQLDVAMEMTQPEENKNDIILSAWQTP